MTYASDDDTSDISIVYERLAPAPPPPQFQPSPVFEELEVVRAPHAERQDNRDNTTQPRRLAPPSTLMLEIAKCRRVFWGRLVLRQCSADVSGHWICGTLHPNSYIPSNSMNMQKCRSIKKLSLAEIDLASKTRQFSLIVFISRYKKCHMMEASWTEFRTVTNSMAATPCGISMVGGSWGCFFRPEDSEVSILRHYAPVLFDELVDVPCLYLVLFRKRTLP